MWAGMDHKHSHLGIKYSFSVHFSESHQPLRAPSGSQDAPGLLSNCPPKKNKASVMISTSHSRLRRKADRLGALAVMHRCQKQWIPASAGGLLVILNLALLPLPKILLRYYLTIVKIVKNLVLQILNVSYIWDLTHSWQQTTCFYHSSAGKALTDTALHSHLAMAGVRTNIY